MSSHDTSEIGRSNRDNVVEKFHPMPPLTSPDQRDLTDFSVHVEPGSQNTPPTLPCATYKSSRKNPFLQVIPTMANI